MKHNTKNKKVKKIFAQRMFHAPRFMFYDKSGYVALLSALIISAVVIVIILTLGQGTYLHRINIADAHYKTKSRALAEACVETALLDLTTNPNYAGNETINVAS